jgi:NTE family protein
MVSNDAMRNPQKVTLCAVEPSVPRVDIAAVKKALVLQGGGALGAYQAGVYAGVFERHRALDWVAGVSIGAINAALIAGNAPEMRVQRLREFWNLVSSGSAQRVPTWCFDRTAFNQWSATTTAMFGVPGFFEPRRTPALLLGLSAPVLSYYDTAPLKATLERLVDFDRINHCEVRFSVGAVNVRTGNSIYFDNTVQRIGPEHIMASGALPPGFAAVEIDGEHYWDGALVSNTPLQWVVESRPRRDTLAFQVDLWSAHGEFPRNMHEVMTREKEIRYSSRTRAGTDQFKHVQRLQHAVAGLIDKLPDELKNSDEAKLLSKVAHRKVYSIVHLIYRARNYEGHSKDYEFSRLSMEEHWRAGYHDAQRTLRHPGVLERPNGEGVLTFDLAQDGRD